MEYQQQKIQAVGSLPIGKINNLDKRVKALELGGGGVAGSTTQVQYNNAGAFGANSGFTYNGFGTIQLSANVQAAGYVQADIGYKFKETDGGADIIILSAPLSVGTGGYGLKLPPAQGALRDTMINDGFGNLSWAPPVIYETIIVSLGDETTAATTGTAVVTFRMPYAMTVTSVRASATTAPTGSGFQFDIKEDGSSIFSTSLTIDAGAYTSTTAATPAVLSDSSLADDSQITIDIIQVGASTAGTGAKIYIKGYRT